MSLKTISGAMASLGRVKSETVERLFIDFSEQMGASGALVGTFDTTEKLLMKALCKDRSVERIYK